MNWYKTAQRVGHRNLAEVKTREIIMSIIDRIKYQGLPKGESIWFANGVDFHVPGLEGIELEHKQEPSQYLRVNGQFYPGTNDMDINIYTPKEHKNIPAELYSALYHQLEFAISHEIIHVPQKEKGDFPSKEYKINNPYLQDKMNMNYITPNEIEAYVRQIRFLSKKWKRPFEFLLDKYLNEFVKVWRKNKVEEKYIPVAKKKIKNMFLNYAKQRYPKLFEAPKS